MKIVMCSDAHLDAVTSGVERYDELARALDWTVELARREEADLWCFVGDLCDPGPRALRCAAKAIEVAEQLHEQDIASVWIAGNHDVVEDGSGATTLSPLAAAPIDGCRVFERPATERLENPISAATCWLLALPYTARSHAYDPAAFVAAAESRVAADPDLPVLVLGHLNLEGIGPGSETTDMPRGRDVYWPLAELDARLPHATKVGGHYHRRQLYRGVRIVGSLGRLTHGEERNEPAALVLEL